MTLTLTSKSNVYDQIINHYVKYIKLGIYKFDDKLPSCRSLAAELGVNPNTVDKAYKKLEEDGYIKTILKKGCFVCYIKDENENKLIKHIEELKSSGISYLELMEAIKEVYKDDKNK